MNKLYITKEEDRLTAGAILVKNKYTVRQGSQRRAGTRSYDYYLEFRRSSGKTEDGRLYIDSEADQLTMAQTLIKNKYTVSSYSQNRSDAQKFYHLAYEPNPATEAPAKKEGEA